MVSKEEVTEEAVEKYYKENYHNYRCGINMNINKQLWIDYQLFCLYLSRKKKLKISPSSRIRLFMIKDMLSGGKN